MSAAVDDCPHHCLLADETPTLFDALPSFEEDLLPSCEDGIDCAPAALPTIDEAAGASGSSLPATPAERPCTFCPNALPLPPPACPSRATLVLDLDGTLIASEELTAANSTYLKDPAACRTPDYEAIGRRVWLRPGVRDFLAAVRPHFEIVLFTAATQNWAAAAVEQLDPSAYLFDVMLHRDHTTSDLMWDYVKDLSRLGRDLSRVVIVDDNPLMFMYQPDNALHVGAYEAAAAGGPDNVLERVAELLVGQVAPAPDVRDVLGPMAAAKMCIASTVATNGAAAVTAAAAAPQPAAAQAEGDDDCLAALSHLRDLPAGTFALGPAEGEDALLCDDDEGDADEDGDAELPDADADSSGNCWSGSSGGDSLSDQAEQDEAEEDGAAAMDEDACALRPSAHACDGGEAWRRSSRRSSRSSEDGSSSIAASEEEALSDNEDDERGAAEGAGVTGGCQAGGGSEQRHVAPREHGDCEAGCSGHHATAAVGAVRTGDAEVEEAAEVFNEHGQAACLGGGEVARASEAEAEQHCSGGAAAAGGGVLHASDEDFDALMEDPAYGSDVEYDSDVDYDCAAAAAGGGAGAAAALSLGAAGAALARDDDALAAAPAACAAAEAAAAATAAAPATHGASAGVAACSCGGSRFAGLRTEPFPGAVRCTVWYGRYETVCYTDGSEAIDPFAPSLHRRHDHDCPALAPAASAAAIVGAEACGAAAANSMQEQQQAGHAVMGGMVVLTDLNPAFGATCAQAPAAVEGGAARPQQCKRARAEAAAAAAGASVSSSSSDEGQPPATRLCRGLHADRDAVGDNGLSKQ